MDEMTIKALICFAGFSLTGWILLLVGIGARREQRRREEREHTRATGRIVDYVRRETRAGRSGVSAFWRPVVEFTAEGQRYCLEYENQMDREQCPVGESVEVLYNVSDPAHFHLEEDLAFSRGGANMVRWGLTWIAASAAMTIALAVLVGGATFDFRHLRRSIGRLASRGGGVEKEQIVSQTEGFQYEVQADSTAVIVSYEGSATRLTIPLLLDGHLVTGISPSAFSRAIHLTELIVPGSMVSIPMAAFVGCLSLSEVIIEEGVRSVGRQAFGFCPSLKNVTLPASLVSISDDAFPQDCAALFHVAADTAAEQYCRERDFRMEIDD